VGVAYRDAFGIHASETSSYVVGPSVPEQWEFAEALQARTQVFSLSVFVAGWVVGIQGMSDVAVLGFLGDFQPQSIDAVNRIVGNKAVEIQFFDQAECLAALR
jgi:hypothetical protein